MLIGVDGLEWRVVLELMEEGRLPVLARLMREGTFGYLGTLKPTLSPAIWTSVATGKRPRKHGIRGFTKPGPEPKRLYTSRDRRTKAIWNILSDAGHLVHCVGWWMTFPAEPIRGVMVAQTNTRGQIGGDGARRPWKGTIVRGLEGQVTPVQLQSRILDTAREVDDTLPRLASEVFGEIPRHLPEASVRAWAQSQWSLRADMTYFRVARDLLDEPGPDPALLMVYFGSPDVLAHHFWRHAYPAEFVSPPTDEEVSALGDLLADDYAWIDSTIGALLDARGDDPTIFVVSDHGMDAAHTGRSSWEKGGRSGDHTGGRPGVLIVSGGKARRPPLHAPGTPPAAVELEDLCTLGTVLDLAPTILALQGLAIGEDMDGRVLESVLEKGFLDRHPLSFKATHDTEQWRETRPQQLLPPEAEEERLDQLRALGYIE